MAHPDEILVLDGPEGPPKSSVNATASDCEKVVDILSRIKLAPPRMTDEQLDFRMDLLEALACDHDEDRVTALIADLRRSDCFDRARVAYGQARRVFQVFAEQLSADQTERIMRLDLESWSFG